MNNEELKTTLTAMFPSVAFEEGTEWLTLAVEPLQFKSIATQLRNETGLEFDFLFCLTAVDWKTHLSIVYHLTSTSNRHTVVIKSKLDRSQPEVETVSDIWRTAEFHEREAYDLFGINFSGHPDQRRLFMMDDYVGWPLRKDFEDAVNMIKL